MSTPTAIRPAHAPVTIARRDFLKAGVLGLTAVGFSQAAAPASAADELPEIGDAPQLFVDLDRVESLDGAQQLFHSAEKHPANPVIRRVKPWEHDRGTWGSVSFDADEKVFKAWYGGQSGREKEFRPGSLSPCSVLCYATSGDGIHWQRPNLGLYQVMGTRENNVVIGDDHHNGLDHWESVLKDPLDSDPARRYKALGWSSNDWDGPMSGIYTMTSPDGLRWKHTPEPVFHYHPRPGTRDLGPIGDSHSLMIDTLRRRYVAYLRSLPNRSLSTSADFVTWTPPRVCIRARDGERVNTLYNHMGFVYGDRYLGLLTYFQRDANNPLLTVRLITSQDGEQWQRPETGRPLIDVGEVGEWDRFLNMITGSPPIRVGDRLYIHYRGLANRHRVDASYAGTDDADRRGGGIGLATLRVDGFASVAASYSGGRVTTKPFVAGGLQLRVNTKADSGSLGVEVLDPESRPIAGFARDDCLPIRTDSVNHLVGWRENRSLAKLSARPIRLRFYLANAHLYSYRATT